MQGQKQSKMGEELGWLKAKQMMANFHSNFTSQINLSDHTLKQMKINEDEANNLHNWVIKRKTIM